MDKSRTYTRLEIVITSVVVEDVITASPTDGVAIAWNVDKWGDVFEGGAEE